MWPKQNFESGFGDWRNRSSGGIGGWGNRNMGGNWKSWQGRNRSNQTNYQKKAKPKPTPKKPVKRTLSKTGTKTKAVANKRQKVVVKYSQIPLTKVMLVNPGDNEGALPELVFGGFYDCSREAKMGKPRHLLQIEATNKSEKKKRGSDGSPEWKVSIPVPITNVEAVSIISGTNPFEKLLKAHSDRISLKNSIEHWNKVIRGRNLALQKKEEELQKLQEIEDKIEEEPVPNKNEDMESEKETAKESDTDDKSTKESDSQSKEGSPDSDVDEEEASSTEKKTEESKKELEKKKKKERETRIRKRKFVTSVVKKLTAAVEKGKQSLGLEQAKLDKISDEWGAELAYFQNEITDEDAISYFKQQLQKEVQLIDKQDEDGEKETTADNDQEDEEMEEDAENLDKSKDAEENTSDVEMANAEDKTEGETAKDEKQKNESDVEAKKVESPKKKDAGKVTEIPVWLVVSLKKKLERATLSADAPVSIENHIKKASMIIMKLHPKLKKTIVLKGVTYQGSEEYLKILNEVLEGPWKPVRKDPEELMRSKSPYSLLKTLEYLVMCQTRCEVMDNIIENCKLCEKSLKHSAMGQHLRDICPMREEECEFCSAEFAASAMENHHESECTKYPISCPAKCSKKFARAEAEEHKKVCQNALVDCEFDSFGCKKQLKRKELSRHLKISVFEHLELVKGRVAILTDYILKNDPTLKDVIKPTAAESESQ